MEKETARLATFKDWSPRFHVQPSDLVKAGLFYVGPTDQVKCFSCHVKLGGWELGDSPISEHRRHSEECKFLSNLNVRVEGDAKQSETSPDNEMKRMARKRKSAEISEKKVVVDKVDAENGKPSAPQRVPNNEEYGTTEADTVCKPPDDKDPMTELTWNTVGVGLNSTEATSGDTLHKKILTSMLYHEYTRLATFRTWPKRDAVDVRKMAEVGFYFLGYSDIVRCAFCDGDVRDWQEGDDPAMVHFTHLSHACAFIRGEGYGDNVPLAGVQPQLTLSSPGSTSMATAPSLPSPGGVVVTPVVRTTPTRSMADVTAREATFSRWPGADRPQPRDLAQAGFYYLGTEDRVRCFTCGGRLNNWEPEDDPWWEHARWFKTCRHVVEKKRNQLHQPRD